MTTIADVWHNEIERLGRALLSQLSPICGTRSTGKALVKSTGGTVSLPMNVYARAAVSSHISDALIVKVAPNPDTVKMPHLTGGAWDVTEAGTEVTFQSFVGGKRFNFKPGTELIFEPELTGIAPRATVTADGFTGGKDDKLLSAVFYDEIGSEFESTLVQAEAVAHPAAMLAWISSAPVEGRTAGLSSGATRKSKKTRAYYENFTLYLVTSTASVGTGSRRREGLNLMQAARNILTDRKRNDDGERISNVGNGLEIGRSFRLKRDESSWIFVIEFRVVSTLTQVDTRVFNPWLKTRVRGEYA